MNSLYENYENSNNKSYGTSELVDQRYVKLLVNLEELEKKSDITTDLQKKYNRNDILADLLRFSTLYPNINVKDTNMSIKIIREPTDIKDGYYLLFEDPMYPIKEIKGSDGLITTNIKDNSNKKKCNFKIGPTSYYIENENDLLSLQKTNTYFTYMVGMFSLTITLFIIFILYVLFAGFDNIFSLFMLLLVIIFFCISLWFTFLYFNNKNNEVNILSSKTLNCIENDKK